ncbi:MAG TPA: helix-turn-helix domain-containing protein, partial [Acidocella sp.]|nr:helix-turn-helix domain-containing protein [Acidocella sp.]
MNVIRFDTDGYPLDQRDAAWREALQRRGVRSTLAIPEVEGSLLSLTSRQGCQFLRITAGPQTLCWKQTGRNLWLCALLDGAAALPDGTALRPSGLWVGTMAGPCVLSFTERFRVLFVILPAKGLDDRLRRMDLDSGQVLLAHGMTEVLAGFLRATAETVGDLDPARLHPLELSLSELLIGALTGADTSSVPHGADRRRSTFQRLIEEIESRLHDADLNLQSLADAVGMSVRAVQKLFQREALSFAQYVRRRRLQHAAQDLLDPQQTKLLVAEIGFRWGFSDPAHFSRAFREQYGMTPSAFRDQNMRPAERSPGDITRGRPMMSLSSRRERTREADDGDEDHPATTALRAEQVIHHKVPLNPSTMHWGYFSKFLPPILTVNSGDIVTIETLTQHATDDWARMVAGDPAAEKAMAWTQDHKGIDRRGAGPMDASIYGRGAGEGFGVHICTGPVEVAGASPGDILEIEILDIVPRPSRAPEFAGRSFGSNGAVWWGYHY